MANEKPKTNTSNVARVRELHALLDRILGKTLLRGTHADCVLQFSVHDGYLTETAKANIKESHRI